MKTIAILSATGLGDIISLGPLTRKLKEVYPESVITVYTQKEGLFQKVQLNHIDQIIVYNPLKILPILWGPKKDLLISWGIYSKISGPLNTLLYPLLLRLFPTREKLVYKREDVPGLKNKNIPEIKLDILKNLGLQIAPEDYHLFIPFSFQGAKTRISALLPEDVMKKTRRLVIFHVGAKKGHTSRLWPTERWIEVIKFLSQKYSAAIAFIGTEDDADQTGHIIERLDFPALNLVNKLSLEETTAIMDMSDLFISTNSGPMWLAAALGKPQIVLCGPSGFAWEPHNDKAVVIRRVLDRTYCDPPCDDKECRHNDNLCMNTITADEVIKKIEALKW